jgi:pimeloyl-ACP methyl ester carboxylesterase
MSGKPTIVFVPGAWHSPRTWDKVASLLERQQYKCVSVALPSTASNPSATFLEDITAVRDSIVAETSQGHDVVVVAHSYSGIPGASAIKGLTRNKQDVAPPAEDASGHVIGLILLASGFMPTGLSFMDGAGGKPPPTWTVDEESGFATIVVDPRELFYHDLPVEEGNYWVGQLTKQAIKPMFEGGEHGYAGWMDIPNWYLSTTEDKAFPVQAQRMVVQMAKDAGADVTVREVASSHSPMLSKPKETADFILEAVASFVG